MTSEKQTLRLFLNGKLGFILQLGCLRKQTPRCKNHKQDACLELGGGIYAGLGFFSFIVPIGGPNPSMPQPEASWQSWLNALDMGNLGSIVKNV